MGHSPFFVLLWSALELSWHLWVCHLTYASELQLAYNETQGLLEVKSSAILDLVGSNQFMSYPQWLCHSFKGCVLLLSLLFQYYICPTVPSCFAEEDTHAGSPNITEVMKLLYPVCY